MPASTSTRVQDAFMRSKAKPRSIDMVSSGLTDLAWLITGWLNVKDGNTVSYLMDDQGFIVVRRPHDARLFRFGDPHFVADDICHIFSGWKTTSSTRWPEPVLKLGDGRKLVGWRAYSTTHPNYPSDVPVLRIAPAWV